MTSGKKVEARKPKLIALDLDFTMWPYHVDSTVELPFQKINGKVYDSNNRIIQFYPEAEKVLDYLKSEGYLVAAASRTKRPDGTAQLLEFWDWNKYFEFKEIYPGSKTEHFNQLSQKSMVPLKEMIFFDDETRNIQDVSSLGVTCIQVQDGIDLELNRGLLFELCRWPDGMKLPSGELELKISVRQQEQS